MTQDPNRNLDLAIIGGGLSGCLFAMALRARHPRLKIGLFEKAHELCGNHTWCLHDQDIPSQARVWLEPLISKSWSGYEVHFPKYSRTLSGTYHSIKSEDLREKVQSALGPALHLEHDFVDLKSDPDGLLLNFASQPSVRAHSVVFCQGWRSTLNSRQLGWQKFVGLEVKLKKPHGLSRPILKDVLQKQTDGYRFIYTLPFSEDRLLVEDTYYSNSKDLNLDRIREGLLDYVQKKGWHVQEILRAEVGQLPLFLDRPEKDDFPWPRLGAGSQFVNPVTGYTLPMTLQMIETLTLQADLSLDSIREKIAVVEKKFEGRISYLIGLNRMMFLAAQPEKRFEILQRFYQLSEGLIGRFYSGQLTWRDRIRILSGNPPVPIFRAIKALTQNLRD